MSIDVFAEFCQFVQMQEIAAKIPGTDAKQQAILAAAFEAFRLYGFRRTSMEDIARGAGMSRASLYLHYRNKEDIFRSLAQGYYDMAAAQVSEVLALDLSPAEALERAFHTQAGPVFEALLSSPHGQELLDTKYAHTEDIIAAGEAQLAEIYADWLARAERAGRVDLSGLGREALPVARTMLSALHGVKASLPGVSEYKASISRLAQMFARALAG